MRDSDNVVNRKNSSHFFRDTHDRWCDGIIKEMRARKVASFKEFMRVSIARKGIWTWGMLLRDSVDQPMPMPFKTDSMIAAAITGPI